MQENSENVARTAECFHPKLVILYRVSGSSVFRIHHAISDFCLCPDWPERCPSFSAPAIV